MTTRRRLVALEKHRLIPALHLDFVNQIASAGGAASTIAALVAITRATGGTDLLYTAASGAAYNSFASGALRLTPNVGLLVEESRTNYLLNSTAPATQTTASLATGTYVLWVNGAGSATSSAGTATGTGFGTATNGTPNIFTLTVAGTVVITTSGALNAFQLEKGANATSLIVTGGATATRNADQVSVTLGSWFSASPAAWVASWVWSGLSSTTVAVEGNGASGIALASSSTTKARCLIYHAANRGDTGSSSSAVQSTGGVCRAALSYDATRLAYAINGASVANSATPSEVDWGTVLSLGSRSGSSLFLDSYLRTVDHYAQFIPASLLTSL